MKNYFKQIYEISKKNNKLFLPCFLSTLLASFFGFAFTPFARAINYPLGITFLALFCFFGALSYLFTLLLTFKLMKQMESKKDKLSYLFSIYFIFIIFAFIILTIMLLIVRAVNPDTQLLIEGKNSIFALVIYYLCFIPFYLPSLRQK